MRFDPDGLPFVVPEFGDTLHPILSTHYLHDECTGVSNVHCFVDGIVSGPIAAGGCKEHSVGALDVLD